MPTIKKLSANYAIQAATDFVTAATLRKHFPHFKTAGIFAGYRLDKESNSMDIVFVNKTTDSGYPAQDAMYHEQNASLVKIGTRYIIKKY